MDQTTKYIIIRYNPDKLASIFLFNIVPPTDKYNYDKNHSFFIFEDKTIKTFPFRDLNCKDMFPFIQLTTTRLDYTTTNDNEEETDEIYFPAITSKENGLLYIIIQRYTRQGIQVNSNNTIQNGSIKDIIKTIPLFHNYEKTKNDLTGKNLRRKIIAGIYNLQWSIKDQESIVVNIIKNLTRLSSYHHQQQQQQQLPQTNGDEEGLQNITKDVRKTFFYLFCFCRENHAISETNHPECTCPETRMEILEPTQVDYFFTAFQNLVNKVDGPHIG
jgi:hypothetical protein